MGFRVSQRPPEAAKPNSKKEKRVKTRMERDPDPLGLFRAPARSSINHLIYRRIREGESFGKPFAVAFSIRLPYNVCA
jgi:hypothetical protein